MVASSTAGIRRSAVEGQFVISSAPWQHASVDGQCELPFAMPRRQTRMQLASVSYSRVPPSCASSRRRAQAHSAARAKRNEVVRCPKKLQKAVCRAPAWARCHGRSRRRTGRPAAGTFQEVRRWMRAIVADETTC